MTKLSDLAPGAAIADGDLFYDVQTPDTGGVKVTANQLASYTRNKNIAQTYYIAANGSDGSNGTSPTTPWQTISRVNSVTPNPGTTFLFRGGDTFSGTIVAAGSGRPNAPITYGSYGRAQATISSSNNGGFTANNLDNLIIQNLIFIGSGAGVNTDYGVSIINTVYCNNYLISNLTVSGYGKTGIYFKSGDSANVSGLNQPQTANITITQCTVHDIGGNGIQVYYSNRSVANQQPLIQASTNVLIDHCTVYNILGSNDPTGNIFTAGFGIVCHAINGATIQYCQVHDNNIANGIQPGNAIYFAWVMNGLIQFNECHHVKATFQGNDAGGIQIDKGCINVVAQYNYIHDCVTTGIATGSGTDGPLISNLTNVTIRYNIIANCGGWDTTTQTSYNTGIMAFTLNPTEVVTGLLIYNNTILANPVGLNSAAITGLFADFGQNTDNIFAVVANNIFIASPSSPFLLYGSAHVRFAGNCYFGGSITKAVIYKNSNIFASIAAWLSNSRAGNFVNQEMVEAIAVDHQVDPLLVTNEFPPVPSPIAGGYYPGDASGFQLSAASPLARAGLDLSSITPFQLTTPYGLTPNLIAGLIDFDFVGAFYSGDVIGSITCARTASTATDLLSTSPSGASYTTFAANTLRITPGRGLLIEEARTQYAPTPTSPSTGTTTSIPNTTQLTLWVNGPGTATVTAGSGTFTLSSAGNAAATQGFPIGLTMTSTGTLTLTVTGTLFAWQLENDPGTGGSQNGGFSGLTTSLITAQGTRDADIVSMAAATAIGTALQAILQGGSGGGQALFFVQIPNWLDVNNTGVNACRLLVDSNNASYVGLQIHAANNGVNGDVILNIGGNILTSSGTLNFKTLQGIGVAASGGSPAQFLVVNGGTPLTSNTVETPTIGATLYLGNRPAGGFCINGYIQRILAGGFVNSQLTTFSSVTPLIPKGGIFQDFFGNPVPGPGGVFSVGAHQPIRSDTGGTVTLNGATTVNIANKFVTANSIIQFSLKTVGGSVGATPNLKTITPGTGFGVAGTAGDTSTYNYVISG